MEKVNEWAFGLTNAPESPNSLVLLAARDMANWLVYAVAIALLLAWVRGNLTARRIVFSAGATAVLAVAINKSIAAFWYHPRPFELGIGHQFLAHAPDASFPSDHGSVMFAVAFALIVGGAAVRWSVPAMLAALGVAWSRVYLGVHWPLDMIGSVVAALVASIVVRRLVAGAGGRLRDGVIAIYDRLLDIVQLPEALFPRSRRKL